MDDPNWSHWGYSRPAPVADALIARRHAHAAPGSYTGSRCDNCGDESEMDIFIGDANIDLCTTCAHALHSWLEESIGIDLDGIT